MIPTLAAEPDRLTGLLAAYAMVVVVLLDKLGSKAPDGSRATLQVP